MTAGRPLPVLSSRGEKLVRWFSRYGIGPENVLKSLFPELSTEALRKFLARLAADGWIVRHPLPGHVGCYWSLSTPACHRLNLKRSGRPLRQTALVRQCLLSQFFAQHPQLELLTASECRDKLPAIFRRGSSNRYFLDCSTPGQTKLGWLLIDDAKAPLRVWTKAHEAAIAKKAIPALHELCVAKQFYLAVATATTTKAAKLEKLFQDRPFAHLPVRVVAAIDDRDRQRVLRKGTS